MNKVEKIIEISENVDCIGRIIVFVEGCKIVGTIVNQSNMISKGILTLREATVCSSLENFECSFSHHKYDWLNIFEEKIIAFSVSDECADEKQEED